MYMFVYIGPGLTICTELTSDYKEIFPTSRVDADLIKDILNPSITIKMQGFIHVTHVHVVYKSLVIY